MKEMKIKIIMNEDYDISITNVTASKTIIIDFEKKSLNAAEIYKVLEYSTDCKYIVESNIEDIKDGNEKDYFYEIVEIINDISNELNNLNNSNTDLSNSNME